MTTVNRCVVGTGRHSGEGRNPLTIWLGFLILTWAAMCLGEPTVLAASADELYREGKFEEAEKLYAEGDMDHPKDIRYRYNRGCAAYQKGDFQSATGAFSSVMRRSEEKETRFRAAYNMGNTAFKQGDFGAAAAYYKQALLMRPEAEDARYNLEIALREEEKREKQKEEQKEQQPSKEEGQEKSGSKGDQQQDQDQSGEGKKSEGETKKDHEEPSGERHPQGEETPKDLSGELAPMQQMDKEGGQDGKETPETSAAMIDKKKAEALLDNVQEDRSRFLQYQLSKEKRRGPGSGKDW